MIKKVIFCMASFAFIQNTSYGAKGPQITFEKRLIDFQQVFRGESLKASFKYENKGNEPLIIEGVHTTCGCTVIEEDSWEPVPPGKTGELNVLFDTADFKGSTVKTVTVLTNQKLLPNRTLSIKANIQEEVYANPPILNFGDLFFGKIYEKKVDIYLNDAGSDTSLAEKIKLSFVNVEDKKDQSIHFEKISTEVSTRRNSHTPVASFLVKIDPKKLGAGFHKKDLHVYNPSRHLPIMKLPIRAHIRGPIEYAPTYVEFGTVAKEQIAKRSIHLKSLDSFDIKNWSASVHINGEKIQHHPNLIQIQPYKTNKNGEKILALQLKNTLKKEGSVHGKLQMKTSDPRQDTVEIDFYAFFR